MFNIIHLLPATLVALGVKRTSFYEMVKAGLVTPPVLIGERSVGVPENEIEAINAARIAGKSKDEIRALVARLVAARKSLA